MDTKEQLLGVIKDYVEIPVEEIDMNEGLKFLNGVDSFVMLSIINSIEESFSIQIPNENLYDFKTLNDIAAYIDSVKKDGVIL